MPDFYLQGYEDPSAEKDDRFSSHRCKKSWNKRKKIKEKYGITLSHDQVTYLCEDVLHAVDEKDFWEKFDAYVKEKGEEAMARLLMKIKAMIIRRKATEKYLQQYGIA